VAYLGDAALPDPCHLTVALETLAPRLGAVLRRIDLSLARREFILESRSMGEVVAFRSILDVERVRPAPDECGTVVTFTGIWYDRPTDENMDGHPTLPEKSLGRRRFSGQLSRFLGLRAR
jgi:hypothetical protein